MKKNKINKKFNKKKTYKGGWSEEDPDFIKYKEYENVKGIGNLTNFEKTIDRDLLLNINNKFMQNFTNLEDVISFIKTLPPDELTDDYNYDLPKFSIIPEGTIFYRRQQTNTYYETYTPLWLDYTGTMSLSKFSFLKDTNEEYTHAYLEKTIESLGPFLIKFKTNRNLLIFHFPSYVTALREIWARWLCFKAEKKICVDGYTLDFLKYNMNSYHTLPILSGYRELCILHAINVSPEDPSIIIPFPDPPDPPKRWTPPPNPWITPPPNPWITQPRPLVYPPPISVPTQFHPPTIPVLDTPPISVPTRFHPPPISVPTRFHPPTIPVSDHPPTIPVSDHLPTIPVLDDPPPNLGMYDAHTPSSRLPSPFITELTPSKPGCKKTFNIDEIEQNPQIYKKIDIDMANIGEEIISVMSLEHIKIVNCIIIIEISSTKIKYIIPNGKVLEFPKKYMVSNYSFYRIERKGGKRKTMKNKKGKKQKSKKIKKHKYI